MSSTQAPTIERSAGSVSPSLSARLHLDVVADDADGEDLDILVHWWAERLPGAHLEPPGMEGAFDAVAVEPAVGQHGEGMGANIVGGEDLAIDIVERDRLVADLDAQHLALADIGELRNGDPFGFIGHASIHIRAVHCTTAIS